eukprot:6478408-Amphidinium_carterae.1
MLPVATEHPEVPNQESRAGTQTTALPATKTNANDSKPVVLTCGNEYAPQLASSVEADPEFAPKLKGKHLPQDGEVPEKANPQFQKTYQTKFPEENTMDPASKHICQEKQALMAKGHSTHHTREHNKA